MIHSPMHHELTLQCGLHGWKSQCKTVFADLKRSQLKDCFTLSFSSYHSHVVLFYHSYFKNFQYMIIYSKLSSWCDSWAVLHRNLMTLMGPFQLRIFYNSKKEHYIRSVRSTYKMSEYPSNCPKYFYTAFILSSYTS